MSDTQQRTDLGPHDGTVMRSQAPNVTAPSGLSESETERIRELLANGMRPIAVAEQLGVRYSLVYRIRLAMREVAHV